MADVISGRPVYFAGGMYGPEDDKKFDFVRAGSSGPDVLPYVTLEPDGLRTTSHHASLYRLSPDMCSAVLVDRRCDQGLENPEHVNLAPAQTALFRRAVAGNRFYD